MARKSKSLNNMFEGPGSDDSEVQSTNEEKSLVKNWLDAVQKAEKREQRWRTEAMNVVRLYEADFKKMHQFNILYSNTETLAPALYSTTPAPVVQRRFKDDDLLGGEASKAVQRALEYLIDDGQAIYTPFDILMSKSVLDALVPGRGVVRFKYDAQISTKEVIHIDPPMNSTVNGMLASEGETLPGTSEDRLEKKEKLEWESCCGEKIPWDRFCHGYATSWQEVPFVAYKWPMTGEELVSNFGELGRKVTLSEMKKSSQEDGRSTEDSENNDCAFNGAWVYEIWDKDTKQVLFISEGMLDKPLRQIDDPLKLTGFFNCPEPLKFFDRVTSLTPQTLYAFYEEQAKELNNVTFRINKLVSALKVRGIYDGSIEALSRIFSEDDNALLPTDDSSAMYDNGGLERAIWLLPIDKIITVLSQLYIQRNQTKQVIYELTGVSDILRGSSNPNETAAAQKIKDQWGNLRLRKLQKRVQAFVVQSLRIMAEIACTKFSEETFKGMTNLPYPTSKEKMAQIQAITQKLPQLMGDPQQAQEAISQLQQLSQAPSWGDILGLLKDDLQRAYKITIETNSTIEPEATEDKESMMGLLNALSQFMLGIQPLMADGSMPFEAAKAIMLTICRRFNFGSEVEDELKKMSAPQPQQGPDPQALEQKSNEIQAQLQELQQKQLDFNQHVKGTEMDLSNKQKQSQMDIEFQQKQANSYIKLQAQEAQQALRLQQQEADAHVKLLAKTSESDLNLKAQTLDSQHKVKVSQIDQQAKDSQAAASETETKNNDVATSLKEVQVQVAEALAAMAAAVQALADSSSKSKSITDSKGRTFTVSSK